MEIAERTVSDVTVLDLKGKMTLGEGDELLKDKINSLLAAGKKKLVLNLEGVPYIDSAGLGEIVRTYTTVSRQGGKLKLLNLTKRIEDLLSITKLLTVFETFDTEAEAVKSFSAEKWRRSPSPSSGAQLARVGSPMLRPARLDAAGAVDEESDCVCGAHFRAPPVRSGRRGTLTGGLFDFLRVVRRRLSAERRHATARPIGSIRSKRGGRLRRAS